MQMRSGSGLQSDINVTPFVDICLVLLIIFMIIIPAMVTAVPVTLPVAKGDPVPEALQQLAITVKDDGTVYVGTLVIRREQIASEMRELHARFPQRPIAVRGDRRVVYGDVIDVLDSCRAAGYTDVRLISELPEPRLAN